MSVIEAGETLRGYAALAGHYDQAYGAFDDRTREAAIVYGLLAANQPDLNSLLDLGTGTGAVMKKFGGRIGELVGLDISPDMLAIARQEVPDAEFIEGDMADFELDREFDAVTCLFNSINHLREFAQWERVFANTDRHLASGGVFIFDMVTPESMEGLAKSGHPNWWRMPDGKIYAIASRQTGENQFRSIFNVKDLVEGEAVTLAAGSMEQTTYPVEQVEDAAGQHFELLGKYNIGPAVIKGLPVQPLGNSPAARATFVYRKP